MAILNRGAAAQGVSFDWSHENVGDGLSQHDAKFAQTIYGIRDLWAKREVGTTTQPLAVLVPGHGAELYRLRKN